MVLSYLENKVKIKKQVTNTEASGYFYYESPIDFLSFVYKIV